eukprot:COSAG04_NODE_19376_length_417_cov_1.594340_2_plen_57_part_01
MASQNKQFRTGCWRDERADIIVVEDAPREDGIAGIERHLSVLALLIVVRTSEGLSIP